MLSNTNFSIRCLATAPKGLSQGIPISVAMYRRLYFAILGLLACSVGIAQPSGTYLESINPNPQYWYNYDHSANIWTIDNHIYITNAYGEGLDREAQIFKIDANTREIVKEIKMVGPQVDLIFSIRGGYCLTSDEHILLTGEWRDYVNTRMRTFLAKLDKDLNVVWVNYYPDLFEYHVYGDAVVETPTGDILLYMTEGKPSPVHGPWIVGEGWIRILKTDAMGGVLLNKIIPDTFKQAVGYGHLSRMEDGNYLLSSQLVGLNYYHPNPLLGLFRYNALLHKIDEDANPIWSRLVNYSTSGLLQEPTSIALPGGGGAVMWSRDTFGAPLGVKPSFQELNCIDSEGNTIWRHGWLDQSLRYFYRIVTAANGDILGVGAHTTGLPNKGKAVIFRATQDGEIIWERHYSDSIQRPWSPLTEMFDICELADGRLAATGIVFDTNAVGTLNPNIGLLVVGADGCLEPGCTGVTQYVTGIFEPFAPAPQLPQLLCSPNPASDFISVKLPITFQDSPPSHMLRAYNSQGILVAEIPWNDLAQERQVQVRNWPFGIYQLLFWKEGNPLFSGKVIVQH